MRSSSESRQTSDRPSKYLRTLSVIFPRTARTIIAEKTMSGRLVSRPSVSKYPTPLVVNLNNLPIGIPSSFSFDNEQSNVQYTGTNYGDDCQTNILELKYK
jgi:hypothetical protein